MPLPFDKKSGYTNPIRELLQNSLDASKDAGNNKCEINIYIEIGDISS
jgi:DNA topoisomerase VI subunit B